MKLKDRENDATTDRLLRRALHGDAAMDATPQCVDPETLAAWMDGSLSGDNLARAEQHASDCARCQAMVASMARTAPVADPRPWWRTVTASWLVPVAAAATALVLWVAVDRQGTAPSPPVSMPHAERIEAPDPAGAALSQDPGDARASAAIPRERYSDRTADSLEPRLPSAEVAEPTPPARDSRGNAKLEKRDAAVSDLQARGRNAASPDQTAFMSTPSAAASASTPQRGVGASGAPRSASTPAPAPAASSQAAASPPAAPAPSVLPYAAEAGSQAGFRVGNGHHGVLARRVAAGRQWSSRARVGGDCVAAARRSGGASSPTGQYPALDRRRRDVDLTIEPCPGLSFLSRTENPSISPMLNAGAAPARDICWIVGSDGIVLLSTDVSWQRRPFTEPVNLTAVRAVDGKAAVVTTEDGRQFRPPTAAPPGRRSPSSFHGGTPPARNPTRSVLRASP